MAPEYAIHGYLSVKSDVFSFGILVLEIVSGRKNYDDRLGAQQVDLLGYVSYWRRLLKLQLLKCVENQKVNFVECF